MELNRGLLKDATEKGLLSEHQAEQPNMYGPDGYDIHVRGGDLIGSYDPTTGKFTVTGFHPLLVEWVNNTSHSNGVVTS